MNGTKQIRQDQQGSVLVVVMGLLFITIGLVLTILDVASDHRKISTRQVNVDQAMYVAEAGLERGARFMESNLTIMVSSSTGATNGSGTLGSGTFNYYIVRTNSSTYCIVSTGTVNQVTRVVSLMDVYQPTYAQYALWSHINNSLVFSQGQAFTGHVHADDELYFNNSGGGPVFHSALTSDTGTYSGSISGIEMDQGLTLNSYQGTMADVNFNSGASSLKTLASSGANVEVSGTTTITFSGSNVLITNSGKSWNNHSSAIPTSGLLIYVANNGTTTGSKSGTIYLEGGTVTGPLTVVSENNMYVENSITYTHNPVTTPSTTDALGLISQDSIWVDNGAPTALTIDAAMIATGTSGDGTTGSFGVSNYSTKSPTGTLTIYGGIVQNQRGAVATVNGSGVTQTGYSKNYSYDPRFINTPPPDYPTVAGKVNFAQWTEGH
jgi:Tfp pilus assembly protein PilX